MPKPSLTRAALRDLDALRRWLTQPGSGERARTKRRDIVDALREIGEDPDRWPVSSDHAGTRERHVHGYSIRYEVDADTGKVLILRVFGPGQNRISSRLGAD